MTAWTGITDLAEPVGWTPCRADPDAWFAYGAQHSPAMARAMCSACPFTTECLTVALEREKGQPLAYRHGIWGGTTPSQRAAMDREGDAA